MSKQITASDLIREVRAVAEERPNFIYTDQEGYDSGGDGCSYVGPTIGITDGEGCIVGQGLSRLDFDMEKVGEWERAADSFPGTGVRRLLRQFGIPFNADEANWLALVQNKQDSHYSWGSAVEFADEHA